MNEHAALVRAARSMHCDHSRQERACVSQQDETLCHHSKSLRLTWRAAAHSKNLAQTGQAAKGRATTSAEVEERVERAWVCTLTRFCPQLKLVFCILPRLLVGRQHRLDGRNEVRVKRDAGSRCHFRLGQPRADLGCLSVPRPKHVHWGCSWVVVVPQFPEMGRVTTLSSGPCRKWCGRRACGAVRERKLMDVLTL
jgi:hypothetical protein